MAPIDRNLDEEEMGDGDAADAGAKLGRLRKFDEFDCPDCSANNPWDEKLGDGDEVRCSYCGEEFKAAVSEDGRLRLKSI
jgi:hypothetical protein